MFAASTPWSAFVEWLLRSSFQASLLICAVLVAQLILRSRITPRWRSALWLLVLLRLLLPWSPRSRLAAYNLLPDPVPRVVTTDVHRRALPFSSRSGDTNMLESVEPNPVPTSAGSVESLQSRSPDFLFLAWLSGALLLSSWLLLQTVITVLAFRKRRPTTDERVLELLEECKERLGIWAYLAVVETPRVHSPALLGWIRPRLLLPEGTLARLTREELRHVFLHELSHLKRHDIAVSWIMTLLQIIHWFNPIVWIAFWRARADMEPASDALALSRLEDNASVDYGRTIVRLLEGAAKPRRLPALAGLAEDAGQMKRRVRMIAMFDSGRNRSWLLPAGLMIALGVPFLANSAQESRAPSNPPTTVEAHSVTTPQVSDKQQMSTESLGERDAIADFQPHENVPPIDAALAAAERWFALTEAGKFRESWREMHSYSRRLISPESWEALCASKGLALSRGGATKVVAREILSVDYQPSLPHGLGDGVSIRYDITMNNGKRLTFELLFVKDHDGQWRFARGDDVESESASKTPSAHPGRGSSRTKGSLADVIDHGSPGRYPIDDALEAAKRYTALTDAGECARSVEERHSYVKNLMSAELMSELCEKRAAQLRQIGRIVSRDVSATEFLSQLPLGLGSGVMVELKVVLQTGGSPSRRSMSEQIWLAKDSDNQWRMVRFNGKLEQ